MTKPKLAYNYDNLADFTRNTIAKTLELAKEHLHTKKLQNKQYYDKDTSQVDIKINDLVLIRSQVKKHKFQEVYDGPYRVIDTSDSYIEVMRNGKRLKVHKNLTKKAQAKYDKEPPLTTPLISLDNFSEEDLHLIRLYHEINYKRRKKQRPNMRLT